MFAAAAGEGWDASRYRLSCGLAGERAVRNDELVVDAAEPDPGELVARAADRDGAVRTPAALVAVALGDRFDVKHIAARRADARQLPAAIELGIMGFPSAGGQREHDAVFRLAADLRHRAGPGPGDGGR